VAIAAWLVALFLWASTRRQRAEWIVLLYCGAFVLALAYATAVSFAFSHDTATPRPWYAQVLLAPMLMLALLGSRRKRKYGRLVGVALVVLFGYVMIVTYWAKLIPPYGGYEGRGSLMSLAALGQQVLLIRRLIMYDARDGLLKIASNG
jgi:hypothetical protein